MRPKRVTTSRLDKRKSSVAPRQGSQCQGTDLRGEVSRVRLVDHTRHHYRSRGRVQDHGHWDISIENGGGDQ